MEIALIVLAGYVAIGVIVANVLVYCGEEESPVIVVISLLWPLFLVMLLVGCLGWLMVLPAIFLRRRMVGKR
jgi:hypothetical protein